MSRSLLGGFVMVIAALAGCYTGGDVTANGAATPPPDMPATSVDPSAITGVPCAVAQVLAKDCASCHAAVPVGGAPNALMSYEDLMAASVTDEGTSAALMSLQRMEDTKNPMPPDGAPAEDLAILQSWIDSGMPKSAEVCDVTLAPNAYDTERRCSSNTSWTHHDQGSESMRPGWACNQCHDRLGRGPSYFAAGTVYRTAHEPDDCNGLGGSAITVVITDAAGKTQTRKVNSAGNFAFDTADIKMPYKAKVVSGGKTRSMSTLQKDGDCNKCHTENGRKLENGKPAAPGRIMAP